MKTFMCANMKTDYVKLLNILAAKFQQWKKIREFGVECCCRPQLVK